MKNIQEAQSDLINDSCNDCGSYVDIGAVIDESDTVLELTFEGESANADAERLLTLATDSYKDASGVITSTDNVVKLAITFEISAEKMIFQLKNGL